MRLPRGSTIPQAIRFSGPHRVRSNAPHGQPTQQDRRLFAVCPYYNLCSSLSLGQYPVRRQPAGDGYRRRRGGCGRRVVRRRTARRLLFRTAPRPCKELNRVLPDSLGSTYPPAGYPASRIAPPSFAASIHREDCWCKRREVYGSLVLPFRVARRDACVCPAQFPRNLHESTVRWTRRKTGLPFRRTAAR